MVGLITLKLQPVSRPAKHPPLPPPSNLPPPIPAKSPRRTKSEMSSALPLPRMQQEWRTVLDEVRNTYLRRQYKQCSARCLQLLQGAPDMVLPLHCIYLSFYAAICFELLARPLRIDCPQKLPLLSLARLYYQKSEHYMWEAEFGHCVISSEFVDRTSLEIHHRFPSSSSDLLVVSRRSSITSATDSASSYASLSSMHSPASSMCSSFSKSEDESCDPLRPQPLHVKKTVSFHLSPPTITSPSESRSTIISPRASRVFQSRLEGRSSAPKSGYTTPTQPMNTITSDTMSGFLLSHSTTRYNTHLTTLRTRLKHHLSTITELISSIQNTHYPYSANQPDHTGCRSKQGNLPTTLDSYSSTLPDITESEQEKKVLQRAARIALLKQRGVDWKLGRGRFDGSRYERLCEEALRELGG